MIEFNKEIKPNRRMVKTMKWQSPEKEIRERHFVAGTMVNQAHLWIWVQSSEYTKWKKIP